MSPPTTTPSPRSAWNQAEERQNVAMFQPRAKGKQRNPPPSLFLHPSPAASHVSLPGILAPGGPPPNSSGATMLAAQAAGTQRQPPMHSGSSSGMSPIRTSRGLRTADSSRSADRTDALWAEMQATLEEVELTASGGTHVFGPDHDRKLVELRAAQIALAQAWARSEADDAIETKAGEDSQSSKGEGKPEGSDGATTTAAGTAGVSGPGNSGRSTEDLIAQLDEETEVDIRLARKRREANDKYFQRVNMGVLDVVTKLEDVSVAMKAVEQETKDIWGENESAPDSSP